MIIDNGYIKLHRKMLKWGWYDDINTFRLFMHCLLKAQWEETEYHGIKLEAGQFATSLSKLSKETKLSVRQTRSALAHLISTRELTSYQQGVYRIITVSNWGLYQGGDKVGDKEATRKRQGERQGSDKVEAGIYTIKEEEKENKENKEDKKINNSNTNNNIYISAFEEFWSIYPRKVDKSRAYKCYQARIKEGFTVEQLLTACKNYARVCEQNQTEQRYIKHGSTFLSVNKDFVDYLELPVEEIAPPKSQPTTTTSSTPASNPLDIPKAVYDKVHNFPERKVDYAALERELLGGES